MRSSRNSSRSGNAEWESSFTHILHRTRQNLDKISLKAPGSGNGNMNMNDRSNMRYVK